MDPQTVAGRLTRLRGMPWCDARGGFISGCTRSARPTPAVVAPGSTAGCEANRATFKAGAVTASAPDQLVAAPGNVSRIKGGGVRQADEESGYTNATDRSVHRNATTRGRKGT
jgi:hypothetical protein